MVLRRASELNARRHLRDPEAASISPEVLVQVAAAAGIRESDVRRALWDLTSEKTAEPYTLARKLYGPARLRAVRELELPTDEARERLENLLRLEQGLKLRRKTEASSLYDPGDGVGMVRRALDLSGQRPLLKTDAVELRVEDTQNARCLANLTADLTHQRGEYLSLGLIIGATLAVLFMFAGFQSPLFLLGVLPLLAAPVFVFKLVHARACAAIRTALDAVLDAAEREPPRAEEPPEQSDRPPGQIRGLKPIPRFRIGE